MGIIKPDEVDGPEKRRLDRDRLERENLEMRGMIDGAYDVIEGWKPYGPFNVKWKKDWLEQARKFGASGE